MLMCRMVVWRVTASVTATEVYLMGQCVGEVLAAVVRRWRLCLVMVIRWDFVWRLVWLGDVTVVLFFR